MKKKKSELLDKIYLVLGITFPSAVLGFGTCWVYFLFGWNVFFSMFIGMLVSALFSMALTLCYVVYRLMKLQLKQSQENKHHKGSRK